VIPEVTNKLLQVVVLRFGQSVTAQSIAVISFLFVNFGTLSGNGPISTWSALVFEALQGRWVGTEL